MKKKLTVNTLALGNLKQRKKQYTIMIIGIILAMIFSSSVLFFVSAIFDSTKEMKDARFGKEDIIWSCTTEENVQKAKEQNIIGKSGFCHIIGSVSSTDENYFDMASVGWFDDTALELANPLLTEGRMPQRENEIAIEGIMLVKMGISAQIGDTIKLNFNVQNGETVFDESAVKEYKLVGILKNKVDLITFSSVIDADKIPTALVCKNTLVDLGGKENLVCYAMFKNNVPTMLNYKKWESFIESPDSKTIASNCAIISNNDVKYINNDSSAYEMQLNVIYIIIVVSVMMLAACMAIVNAFISNLKQRKKQIGLLRAVGTTKRQIINIYGREALIISLITTPISCLISFLVVKLIVGFMGDPYVFKPHLWCFICAVAFSIISVMVASLIPLVSASKITPIQAIRNIDDNRKMKLKKIKSQKDFSVSKLLSKRSITFGRGKQIAVTLILVISIIGSGFAFSWYSYDSKELYSFDNDYEVYLSADGGYLTGVNFKSNNNGFSEIDKQTALSNKYISGGLGVKKGYVNLITNYDSSDYRKEISDKYSRNWDIDESLITSENYEKEYFANVEDGADVKKVEKLLGTSNYFSCQYASLDSDYIASLKDKVISGKINIDKINSGEEIVLVAPKNITVSFDDGKYGGLMRGSSDSKVQGRTIFSADCDFFVGDELEMAVITADRIVDITGDDENQSIIPDNADVQYKKVKIGAIIDDLRGNLLIDSFCVLTSHSAMNSMLPHLRYKSLFYSLNTECTTGINESVMETLNSISSNVEQASVRSDFGYKQEQKATLKKVLIVMMAVIILLFSISISIVNNTITASIRNSKQKIGTLRAVGADERELVKSYIYQLLSMILWGEGIGLFGFVSGYFMLYFIMKSRGLTFGYVFNPIGPLVFAVITFVVCSVNLWAKVRKEMKNSIVENIREL